MAAPKLKALIVQHEEPTPPGLLGEWLDQQNAQVDILRIDLEEKVPDAREYQLIASLGSEFAAFDDSVPYQEFSTDDSGVNWYILIGQVAWDPNTGLIERRGDDDSSDADRPEPFLGAPRPVLIRNFQ